MKKYKNYGDTFIYSKKDTNGNSAEQNLLEFVLKSDRIDKNSDAFKPVREAIKTRQTTAVLYRMLMNDMVILCIGTKELPASFKVFEAKDLRAAKKDRKIFIDVTGLVKLNNGYFVCKEIDKLCAYLSGALINAIYYEDPNRLLNNAAIIKSSSFCYTKMFVGILDYLRITGYADNAAKITYIVATYYLYNLMDKDIKSARATAANLVGINIKEAEGYNFYYDYEKDFEDINIFVTFLADTFKLKGLSTDVFIDRWIYLYGKGTMYGAEIFPAFIIVLAYAYSGSYINNQKRIETTCSRDMVTVVTTVLNSGSEMFDKGFHYESAFEREELADKTRNK